MEPKWKASIQACLKKETKKSKKKTEIIFKKTHKKRSKNNKQKIIHVYLTYLHKIYHQNVAVKCLCQKWYKKKRNERIKE